MSIESRRHRPPYNGPFLSIPNTPSSSSSSIRSSDGGFSQPPPTQHLVIREPKKWTQKEDPHHVPNPANEESRRLRVRSIKENKSIEVDATFVTDINECWVSEDLVERLKLKRTPSSTENPEYGLLAKKTFEFRGTVTLEWIDRGKSKPTKCRIVPSDTGTKFEVYLCRSLLPPLSPQGRAAVFVPRTLSPMPPSGMEEYPSAADPLTEYAGLFDGDGQDGFAEFMDDKSNDAKCADIWMSNLKQRMHDRKPPEYVRDDGNPPVKVAVLDTGVDSKHNFIKGALKKNRIKLVEDFVKDVKGTQDINGHGTHVAALVMRVAPGAQIYIAKVATHGKIPSDHSIAEAIKWAIELEVDIITMSFGMDKDHPAMQDQIAEAYRKNIIMLAAASNRGHNYEVTYPARRNEVICVYSTDGNGKSSPSNPTRLKNLGYHFATLGVAVKSAWPGNLPELPTKQPSDKPSERRMTGSSFATPIVAGIAAHILGFAHMHGIKQDLYKKLRSHEGMQEVFAEHLAERTEDGLDYINPGKLFADYRSNDEIVFLIEDTLKRRIGISVGADVFD